MECGGLPPLSHEPETHRGRPRRGWPRLRKRQHSLQSGAIPRFPIFPRYNEVYEQREVSELLKKALELPVADRAELAGSILESLDQAEDESVQEAWEAEILRRMEELDSGRVKPVSHDEVLRRLASAIE
jgi:putative addiction module component (TIGR02574 family)